jgi:hypothetical protein
MKATKNFLDFRCSLSLVGIFKSLGAPQGLIGNPVGIGDGPAAVIGDESRILANSQSAVVNHLAID